LILRNIFGKGIAYFPIILVVSNKFMQMFQNKFIELLLLSIRFACIEQVVYIGVVLAEFLLYSAKE